MLPDVRINPTGTAGLSGNPSGPEIQLILLDFHLKSRSSPRKCGARLSEKEASPKGRLGSPAAEQYGGIGIVVESPELSFGQRRRV